MNWAGKGVEAASGAAFTKLLDGVVAADAKTALAQLGRMLPYAVHLAGQLVEKSIQPLIPPAQDSRLSTST